MARESLRGTGVIVGSNRDPRVDPTWRESYRDDGLINQLFVGAVGLPVDFTIEVTVPGREPYQTTVRTRVPTKAEKTRLLSTTPLPKTLPPPVIVAEDEVAIDWKAFVDDPNRIQLIKEAHGRAVALTVQHQAAANPDKFAAIRATNKGTAASRAESVRGGAMTRRQYEQSGSQLVRLGHMDPADYEAGLHRIEEA